MAMRAVGNYTRRVTSWKMRTAISRPEFLIVTVGFVDETNSVMMSGGLV